MKTPPPNAFPSTNKGEEVACCWVCLFASRWVHFHNDSGSCRLCVRLKENGIFGLSCLSILPFLTTFLVGD